MNRKERMIKILRYALSVMLITVVGAAMIGQVQPAAATHGALEPTGLICTTNDTATFTLTTQTGYITLPDGNTVYMWGLSENDQPFQHPSPYLCVNEGDTVTVVVHNTLAYDISLIFPGQKNVLANGEPSQPVYSSGELVSLAQVAPANGGTVTYQFVAETPGTYIYESGTEPMVQINMGLFGGLIVYPENYLDLTTDPTGSLAYAYDDPATDAPSLYTAFNPNYEYAIIMSEIDPMLHMAVEQGQPYDITQYRSRYWLYNGRSFPDTVADSGAPWLPNQPYGSMTFLYPMDPCPYEWEWVGSEKVCPTSGNPNPAYNPYPALIRYLSAGAVEYPHHPHGNHGRVIARDGHVLIGQNGEDLTYEKFLVNVQPGQTWDSTFEWIDAEHWDPVHNPIPVTIPQLANLVYGTFFSGSAYLGNLDALPVGQQALNQCGEYWHIAHNHALQQITAWGVVLSGQITFTRIDPPLPNDCQ